MTRCDEIAKRMSSYTPGRAVLDNVILDIHRVLGTHALAAARCGAIAKKAREEEYESEPLLREAAALWTDKQLYWSVTCWRRVADNTGISKRSISHGFDVWSRKTQWVVLMNWRLQLRVSDCMLKGEDHWEGLAVENAFVRYFV